MASIQHRPKYAKPWRVMWRDAAAKQCSRSFATKKDATKFARALDIGEESTAHHRAIDLETAACEWLDSVAATCADRTLARYRWVVSDLCAHLGVVRVDAVTVRSLEQWRNDKRKGLAASTVRNNIKAMRAFFAWCVSHGYCSENQAAKVAVPRVKRKIPEWLDAGDTNRLLCRIAEHSQEYGLACLFAARAGLRRGEIRALRWADVDLTDGALYVRDTKSKEPRIVPMHHEIAAALMDWPQSGPYVFPGAGNYKEREQRSNAQGKAINAWLRANKYGVTLHGLRHSFASQLAGAGASESAIRDLLGHTSLEVTRLYTHSRLTAHQQAIARLGNQDAPTAQESQPQVPAKHGRTPDTREA